MSSFILVWFWLCLAFLFLVMSGFSFNLRRRVPMILADVMEPAAFQGPEVDRLLPLFNDMLWMELTALVLTSAAAFVEYLALIGML